MGRIFHISIVKENDVFGDGDDVAVVGAEEARISVLCLPASGWSSPEPRLVTALAVALSMTTAPASKWPSTERDAAGQQALVVAQGVQGAVVDADRAFGACC